MITLPIILLNPVVGELATPLKALVLTVVVVPAIVYVAMPVANRRLDMWIER